MKLSVMMVAYNEERHIGAALASLLGQSGMSCLDVIVIDDGSTDRTAACVAAIAQTHPQVRLIRTANQGVARARNAALRALPADADLVSFLDADDLVPSGRYARDLAHFAADPQLDMVFGATTLFDTANAENTAPAAHSRTATGRSVVLAAGLYRAGVLREVGLFDESFSQAEDMDFLLRFFEKGPRYLIQPETCLYYRRHAGNMTRDRTQLRKDFSRALMLAMRRRRQHDLPPFPADIFDAASLAEANAW